MDFKIKNFSIEKFNNDVNNSGNLIQKYSGWSGYRKAVSEFISKNTEGSKGSLFVFGAGECNDLDINFLTSEFDKIFLSDIDIKSIDEGIKRQDLPHEKLEKIKKIKAEYTGLSDFGFFKNLSEMTAAKTKSDDISEYIKNTIKNLRTDGILYEHKNQYDMVLILPTYTQLAYTQIETLLRILYRYGIYPLEELNKILTTMHYCMPSIIKKYNDVIVSMLKDNGRAVVLSDVAEITDEKVLSDVSKRLNDYEYIDKYLKKHGQEFGIMGIEELKAKTEFVERKFVIWPFDNDKQFIVEFVSVRLNN